MSASQDASPKRGFFSRFGAGLTATRNFIVNLVFFGFLLLMISLLFIGGGQRPSLQDNTVMILSPQGAVVDQLSVVHPAAPLLGEGGPAETLLSNMVKAVRLAAKDERISALLIGVHDLSHIGLSRSLELQDAIAEFRASAKPIIAFGDYYDQDSYLLASMADEVYMHPMGGVALEGFANYGQYYKSALDKLKVKMQVFRAGSYKSAMEPFTRDDMSAEAKEAAQAWLDDLWSVYVNTVADNRELSREELAEYIDYYDEVLLDHNKQPAMAALRSRLVDGLKSRPEFRAMMRERFTPEGPESYRHIQAEDYLYITGEFDLPGVSFSGPNMAAIDGVSMLPPSVGIIVADGMIVDGSQPPGMIGGDSTAAMIRAAREDSSIKALVLRVNSGGGSAFASELIRQELLALKAAGKPLVVSMGAAAASGGYWIAADADEIWALPSTITGSIGVFGAFPNLETALSELGISTDGVGTTAIAGGLRVDRTLNPAVARALQYGVDDIYQRFLALVAEGRDMSVAEARALAEGRVWSGLAAQRMGLVDKLGGLDQAVASAANLAGLDAYERHWVEEPLPPLQMLMRSISQQIMTPLQLGVQLLGFAPTAADKANMALLQRSQWLLEPVLKPFKQLLYMNDPAGVYLQCVACFEP